MVLPISEVYLARHATPDWSRKDLVYHLPPGPPLTPQGIAEARALGAFLAQKQVCQIYSSPLERCQHTAQIAATISGAQLCILPELMEFQPQESHADILARLLPAFNDAARSSAVRGGPEAIVTHGGPVEFLLARLGLDESSLSRVKIYDHRNPLPPAGAWLASLPAPNGAWQLQLVFTPSQQAEEIL